MMPTEMSKADVLAVMHRLGLDNRIGEAEERLPDPVVMERDMEILTDLGLSFDDIVNDLGGSPW